jgi:hypothetical protein
MRYFTPILLFLSVFTLSCGKTEFNDLDEYGLVGKVRTVSVTTYTNLHKSDGKWIPEEAKISVTRKLHFSEEGHLEIWESAYISEFGDKNQHLVKFFQEDNRKSKSVTYSEDGDIDSEYYFNWISNTEYEFGDTTESGSIFHNISHLSPDNGRDLKGEIKFYTDGELKAHEVYENELDGNRIVSSTTEDLVNHTTTVHEITYLKDDEHGNPIEYYIIDASNDELVGYIIREITYYE